MLQRKVDGRANAKGCLILQTRSFVPERLVAGRREAHEARMAARSADRHVSAADRAIRHWPLAGPLLALAASALAALHIHTPRPCTGLHGVWAWAGGARSSRSAVVHVTTGVVGVVGSGAFSACEIGHHFVLQRTDVQAVAYLTPVNATGAG